MRVGAWNTAHACKAPHTLSRVRTGVVLAALTRRRWTAVPDDEWPTEATQRGIILADFAPGCGDRRQEIVFIGVSMDEVRADVLGRWGEHQ